MLGIISLIVFIIQVVCCICTKLSSNEHTFKSIYLPHVILIFWFSTMFLNIFLISWWPMWNYILNSYKTWKQCSQICTLSLKQFVFTSLSSLKILNPLWLLCESWEWVAFTSPSPVLSFSLNACDLWPLCSAASQHGSRLSAAAVSTPAPTTGPGKDRVALMSDHVMSQHRGIRIKQFTFTGWVLHWSIVFI